MLSSGNCDKGNAVCAVLLNLSKEFDCVKINSSKKTLANLTSVLKVSKGNRCESNILKNDKFQKGKDLIKQTAPSERKIKACVLWDRNWKYPLNKKFVYKQSLVAVI